MSSANNVTAYWIVHWRNCNRFKWTDRSGCKRMFAERWGHMCQDFISKSSFLPPIKTNVLCFRWKIFFSILNYGKCYDCTRQYGISFVVWIACPNLLVVATENRSCHAYSLPGLLTVWMAERPVARSKIERWITIYGHAYARRPKAALSCKLWPYMPCCFQ